MRRILGWKIFSISFFITIVLFNSNLSGKSRSDAEPIWEEGYRLLFNTILQHIKTDYVIALNPKEIWKTIIEEVIFFSNVDKEFFLTDADLSWFEKSNEKDASVSEARYIQLFNKVIKKVNELKDPKIDPVALWQHAINGALKATNDDQTAFLDQEEFSDLLYQKNQGGSIGVNLGKKESQTFIIFPLENSPALRAGLQSGDIIVEVDGQKIENMPLRKVVRFLRGVPGTRVSIKLLRTGHKGTLEFNIVREVINPTVVTAGLIESKKKIGYIKLQQFSETAASDIGDELKKLKRLNIMGVILDLRNNPGGLFNSGIEISNMFIPDGIIVSTKGRHQGNDRIAGLSIKK